MSGDVGALKLSSSATGARGGNEKRRTSSHFFQPAFSLLEIAPWFVRMSFVLCMCARRFTAACSTGIAAEAQIVVTARMTFTTGDLPRTSAHFVPPAPSDAQQGLALALGMRA